MAQQQSQAAAQLQQEKQAFEAQQNELDRITKLEVEKIRLAGNLSMDADGNGRRDEIDRQRLEVERQRVEAMKQKG
jgi:hypothetical protein